VLVKDSEHLNLTVKAVTKIFNVEEIQVHKTPKGKAEINKKVKLTVKCSVGQTERKERLEARTLMTSSESGMRNIKKDMKFSSNTSTSRTCKLGGKWLKSSSKLQKNY
jgi:hypothetical protein